MTDAPLFRVGTINVADGNTSPFEYNDESKEIAFLDKAFCENLKAVVGNEQDIATLYANVNRLSKDYTNQRYSPLYNRLTDKWIRCDTTPTHKLFRRAWIQHHNALYKENQELKEFHYTHAKLNITNTADVKIMREIAESLCLFDYCMILALRDIRACDTYPFSRIALDDFHSDAEEMRAGKLEMIGKFLIDQKLNALMVQEVTTNVKEWQHMLASHGYKIYMNSHKNTGIILCTTEKVKKVNVPLTKTMLSNEVLALQCGNLLLISAHMNSKNHEKAKGNPKNYEDQMAELLAFIEQYKVANPTMQVIVGMDCNHHPVIKRNVGSIFPKNTSIATTRKERTSMQAQQHKIHVRDTGTKDHIFVDISSRILHGNVLTLSPNGNTHQLLPNNDHPCDHFVSVVTIKL